MVVFNITHADDNLIVEAAFETVTQFMSQDGMASLRARDDGTGLGGIYRTGTDLSAAVLQFLPRGYTALCVGII